MADAHYIVIDGVEGVGKSIITERLARELQAAQIPVQVIAHKEHAPDPSEQAIKRVLSDQRYPMHAQASALLNSAAFARTSETIRANLAAGITCIADFSYLSTLVRLYYGRGDITDYALASQLLTFASGTIKPNLHLILDAPVNVIQTRPQTDKLDEAYLERIRAGFLWEAKQHDLPIVYATDPIEVVFSNVRKHVDTLLLKPTQTSPSAEPKSVAEVLAANPPTKATPAKPAPPVAEPPVTAPPIVSPAPPEPEQPAQKPKPAAQEKSNEKTAQADSQAESQSQPQTPENAPAAETGRTGLTKYVTNTTDNVYAFTPALPPMTVATVMAQFSYHGDDIRTALLDKHISQIEQGDKPLSPTTAAYGNDSVQQLTSQHIVVEGASQLLANKLEWGRLATYLERSTDDAYYDQKDANGRYRYYRPPQVTGKIRSLYVRSMDQIFEAYSKLATALTTHVRAISTLPKTQQDADWYSATKAQAYEAIRPLLPVAATSTVGIYASGQALESLIVHLLSDELPEARTTGRQILDEARKAAPATLEHADDPERGGALQAYRAATYANMKKLAAELLPSGYTAEPASDPVALTSYTPHNELEVVADMLYEHSDQPLSVLQQGFAHWPYQRKADVMAAYMGERLNRRHKPGRALEKIHYSFDLVCDYGTFRDLQRHRMVDDLEWQALSPRLGYEIPTLVEEAGLAEAFEACFDLSLQLYSALQAAGFPLEAQYATLLGHRMRWKVTYNAREAFHLHELRTSPQGRPGYRKLVQEIHTKVAEVHPMLAEAMKFVNQGEDPELTRLAAERYADYKQAQLDKPATKLDSNAKRK